MYCPHCGSQVPDGEVTCANCGGPVTTVWPPIQAPVQTGPPQPVRASGTAKTSLVFGILRITILPFIGGIIALISGLVAQGEIQRSEGALEGRGMATAGIVLGGIGIVLPAIVLCIAFYGLPFFLGPRIRDIFGSIYNSLR